MSTARSGNQPGGGSAADCKLFSVVNEKNNNVDSESSDDENDHSYNSKGKPIPRPKPDKVDKIKANRIKKEPKPSGKKLPPSGGVAAGKMGTDQKGLSRRRGKD